MPVIILFSCLRLSFPAKNFVRISHRWTIGALGFDSRREPGIFLFTTASRTALGPIQPPIQWVRGALSLGVRRPGREADRSPPSSAEIKDAWRYNSTPPRRLHGVVLSEAEGQFYLYLIILDIITIKPNKMT
jgi:hypothetical protein